MYVQPVSAQQLLLCSTQGQEEVMDIYTVCYGDDLQESLSETISEMDAEDVCELSINS